MKLLAVLAHLVPVAIANGNNDVLEVYHVNPYHLGPYPINMNTGDAVGDLFFDLKMVLMNPLVCTAKKHNFFNFMCQNQEVDAPDLVVNKLHISKSKAWSSKYAYCNVGLPNGTDPFGNACPANQYCCVCGNPFRHIFEPCDATVAVENVKQKLQFPPRELVCNPMNPKSPEWLCWQSKLTDKLSDYNPGYWFSMLDYGYCPHHPGGGANCTWEVASVDKIVNKTCHSASFFGAVEAHNQACFDGCGRSRNATSPCWVRCFYTTVLGPHAGKPGGRVSGLPMDVLVKAWTAPFRSDDPAQGGCPGLPIASTVKRGTSQSELIV